MNGIQQFTEVIDLVLQKFDGTLLPSPEVKQLEGYPFSFFVFTGGTLSRLVYLFREFLLSQLFLNTVV